MSTRGESLSSHAEALLDGMGGVRVSSGFFICGGFPALAEGSDNSYALLLEGGREEESLATVS